MGAYIYRYMAYNIYFKFAVDNYSLFGGDENAHKVEKLV